jgi:Raf kinase inhibitor-like YbhB/YbcL family protein
MMGFALSDMRVSSAVFDHGGMIPRRNTGEGEDLSPPLIWCNAPEGTGSYAVICHDPDAPLLTPKGSYGFVHWVLYNIPAAVESLSEGVAEYTRGKNNFGNMGYGGPMPPEGHGRHNYYFWVMALNHDMAMAEGLTMRRLLKEIEPYVIGMNRLVGGYERS